ncbi:multisite-specific tRNA:(cytosine-C(5))-methyltransferase isoform X1 [Canna indica]|uniref:Multisite-specific tRNA:(Cytosine-C(5))-methyltransferase isoform X1 n=1 Tax=Canna indica TaxID=4628 RepID=A0AAQ3JW78_9LILI|nr:multisite-specific tRNA:(cytosine-C(5))-methyltransferase isoform X1 [Canna indica]
MGGGRKRGRTQRRHFKQGRENVWKYGNKEARPDDPAANVESNPTWQPFATQNSNFDEYYKEQNIVPEDEWEEFICTLRKPLPAAFRINSSGQFCKDIMLQLENDFLKSLKAEVNDEYEMEAIRPLPWYPGNLAWHLNFSRMQLRKNQTLERFHEFLKQENEVGNITRQEAVSMVPPLFLDVLPEHHILDMCAAPGSKTFQLLEMIHESTEPGLLPNGLVIANDADVQRCNLLIHQTKRMSTANLVVTNHEAQHFPTCYSMKDHKEISKGEEVSKSYLQFDRVLCDVPCSGDGTLRKAPDIWRKWNAGMGNGLHRLQVEIAMRGVALLKVGGRMVYSTCSMNPVENEAVVAEVLRRSGGSIKLLDVSDELPGLIRRPGLITWKIKDRGIWLACYKDVPKYRRSVILPSMFPSGQSHDEILITDGIQEHAGIPGSNSVEGKVDSQIISQPENLLQPQDMCENLEKVAVSTGTASDESKLEENSSGSVSAKKLDGDIREEISGFPLENCMRIVPHDQNSGAFFIAVFEKLTPLQAIPTNPARHSTESRPHSANINRNLNNECKEEMDITNNVQDENINIASLATSDVDTMVNQSTGISINDKVSVCSEDNELQKPGVSNGEDNGPTDTKEVKSKSQSHGKWRGIDPVVFFKNQTIINSIRSFYGISESFPLDGHLVTRNSDSNHVKRIYYISKSVQDILQLNIQIGERLKITSVGLKIFERQKSNDSSTPCSFRLSSEGLPLLLPYTSKQIICAPLRDFQQLLQQRTVKFVDCIDACFREKASNLMPGCCVIVLNEGNEITNDIVVDASTIAIICWKGKTNLGILLSPSDGQELLERVALRFGIQIRTSPKADEIAEIDMDETKD